MFRDIFRTFLGLALGLSFVLNASRAHANVYATNIKIDGSLSGTVPVAQGSGATITYVLNDAASSGITLKILSNSTPVRTITIAGGHPGAANGLNTVVWDTKNDSQSYVAAGTYSVSITAASSGYTNWTQFVSSTGGGGGTNLWPSGIAVDTNLKSPYYGRVMVANGGAANASIVKCNADGSLADEGQSDAGYSFPFDGNNGDSVRSLKYLSNDTVVFDQWTGDGQIVACDMIMSTNQILWDTGSLPGAPWAERLPLGFGDIDVTGIGATNANGTSAALAWAADGDSQSAGVWVWPLTNNGAYNPNFPGVQIIHSTNGCAVVNRTGYGLMVDSAGDIFMGQTKASTDTSPGLFAFTNWPSATLPICGQHLAWSVGTDSSMAGVQAVAIDSRTSPNYLSVAMNAGSAGCLILRATNGAVITGIHTNGGAYYVGTGWDAVGNVYLGNTNHSWQAFSPPGANTNTTSAISLIQVLVAPHITSISASGGTVTIHFTSSPSDPVSAFTLLSSAAPAGPYAPASGAVITGSAGAYTATVPTSGAAAFYRIKR